ncbi:hypothetical protein LIER_31400 [Lithospermum erythrorhizon]|uniref:GIR1-like zinc ribbon domain-containing protein n=1 Tax=Lithospermum erythrorhizon TaxID=34254 RepID=A0AAV3RQU4_LITER
MQKSVMATEVSSIMGKSRVGLVTMDLLGGYCTVDSKELDLDLHVPSGFEKRLDMKSGKLYLHKCNSQNYSISTSEPKQSDNPMPSKFNDLNFPPVLKKPLNHLDDGSLDLKLVLSASSSPSSASYQSVCTLDKVKSALERAEKETKRKRSLSLTTSKSTSSPSSNSSSSIKDREIDQEDNSPASFATGCPSCLMYVLISKSDPKCPRCKNVIPSPPALKKPRIDLNISI